MTTNNPPDNTIYMVKNGKIEVIDNPKSGFGKTIIHWQDGKPVLQEIIYTKNINK